MNPLLLGVGALVAAGCGSNHAGGKDAPTVIDAVPDAPTIDGPAALPCTVASGTTMSARKIGSLPSGSVGAVIATAPPNDGRLFVVAQIGSIYIFDKEQLVATPFLDITSKVVAGGEQGLLGLTFHPNYATNHKFYVDYTATNTGADAATNPWLDIVEEYTASGVNTADPASGKIILAIPDFATNHNAGRMEVGSDGYLYVSTGDGGGGGDPHRNAQAIDHTAATCTATTCQPLLGKVLRLDVDHPASGKPYGIPTDNPFAAGGGEPEIFIYGLRNPWRWSFDRGTGDMWIADVGQNMVEEIDMLPAGQQAGKNMGWSMWEGNSCYGNYTCSMTGMTFPQFTHTHTNGWVAVIGGAVYRGACYPDIVGQYYFTDYGAHQLERGVMSAGTLTVTELPPAAPATDWPQAPSSIHADSRGELYETTTSGDVYHLEAGP